MKRARCAYVTMLLISVLLNVLFPTGVNVLITSILVLLPVATLILNRFMEKWIVISADITDSVTTLGNVNSAVTIKCDNSLCVFPSPRISVCVSVWNEFEQKKSRSFIHFPVPHRSKLIVKNDIQADHCGCIHVHISRAVIYDMLGITQCTVKLNVTHSVAVLPELVLLEEAPLIIEADGSDGDIYSDSRSGADRSEVFDHHEYVQGDSIKDINWKLSARTDATMVKSFSLSIKSSTLLICEFNSTDLSQVDRTLSAICSLSGYLSEHSCAHSVSWFCADDGFTVLPIDVDEADGFDMIHSLFQAKLYHDDLALSAYLSSEQQGFANIFYITGSMQSDTPDLLLKLAENVSVTIFYAGSISLNPELSVILTQGGIHILTL